MALSSKHSRKMALLVLLMYAGAAGLVSLIAIKPSKTKSVENMIFTSLKKPTPNYTLTIYTNLEKGIFEGRLIMQNENTINAIVLDCSNSVQILTSNGAYRRNTEGSNIYFDTGKDDYLNVSFRSNLSNDNHGYYAITQNNKIIGASTQFEPIHARRVFPCHDRPDTKVSIQLNLFVPDDFTGLSNTGVIKRKPHIFDGIRGEIVSFDQTPVMAPYLLAFAIGKWDNISMRTESGVDVVAYAPIGQTDLAKFALKHCADSLSFFETEFGVPYPMKLHQIAVIPDFAAGAMENWGLVTYRDTAMLADPVKSSKSALQRVAEVVVHENAHMWAGNLVSPKSWDYLWLNEGFATLLPIIYFDNKSKDLGSWDNFRRSEIFSAMHYDLSPHSHPVMSKVGNGESASTIFDPISYSKGAAVIDMLRTMITPQIFSEKLKKYFIKHSFSSVLTSDLADSMKIDGNYDVKAFLNDWTERVGFPIIKVEGNTVSQSSITYLGPGEAVEWPILLSIEGSEAVYLTKGNLTIDQSPLVINAGRKAMAIVNYDDSNLNKLKIHWIRLSSDAKWTLLQDLQLLIMLREKKMEDLLLFTILAASADDPVVFDTAVDSALFIIDSLKSQNQLDVQMRIADAFRPYHKDIEKAETTLEAKTQQKLLGLLAFGCNDQDTRASLMSKIEDLESLSESLCYYVYRLCAETHEGWTKIYDIMSKTSNPQIRQSALRAMASAKAEADARSVLSLIKDGSIRPHEIPMVFMTMAKTDIGSIILKQHIVEDFEHLKSLLGVGPSIVHVVRALYETATSDNELEVLFSSVIRMSPPSLTTSFAQARDTFLYRHL